MGEQLFAKNIRIIDDPLRVRGLRSQTFDAEGVKVKKHRADRRGRADHVAARLRHRARTRAGHDRPCPSRRFVVAVAGIVQSASRSPAR